MPLNLVDSVDRYSNFTLKIPTYAPSVGITPAEVAADFAFLQYAIAATAFTAEAKGSTAYRDILLGGLQPGAVAPGVPVLPVIALPAVVVAPGILPRVRALAKRIEVAPAYDEAMGEDLQLIAATTAIPSRVL